MATNGLTGVTSKFSEGFTKFSMTNASGNTVTLPSPFDEEGFIEILLQSTTGISAFRFYNAGKHVPSTAPLVIQDNASVQITTGVAATPKLAVASTSSAAYTVALAKNSTTGAITLVNNTHATDRVAYTIWVRLFA
jgi:hypothetical protein